MSNKELEHESFIQSFPNSRYFQSVEYNKTINPFNNFILTIKDSSNNVKCSGIVSIISHKKEFYFYCPRGPIFNINDFPYFLEFVNKLKEIKNEYKVSKFICNPPLPSSLGKFFSTAGFFIESNPSKTIEPPNAIIIKALDENEMFNGMSKESKKNVRKAYNNSLSFFEHNNAELFDLESFYSMYLNVSNKHNFTPRSKEYFQKLISKISHNNLYFSEVKFNNKILSMSIDFLYNGILSCLYSVSNNEFKEKKPNNFLHWGRMKFCAQRNDIKFFECGGVYCDGLDNTHPDYGVYKFKMSLCNGSLEKFIGDISCVL